MFGYYYCNHNMNWLIGIGMIFGALNSMFSSNRRAYTQNYYHMPLFSNPTYPVYQPPAQNYNLVGDALSGISSAGSSYYTGGSTTSSLTQIAATRQNTNYNLVGDALVSAASNTGMPFYGSDYITMPPNIGVPYGAPYSTYLNAGTNPSPSLLQIAASGKRQNTLTTSSVKESPVNTPVGNNSRITRTSTKVRPSRDIINRVKQIAAKINCDYKDLMGLIYSESGFYTVTPGWDGKKAIGLIQFTDICIEDLNRTYNKHYTKASIAKMTALQQLDLAELVLIRAKKIADFPANHRLTAGELYAINFAPANAKKNSVAKRGDGLYEGNEGLDINKDGKITKNELGQRVKNKSLSVVC